jgi:hypothetical protein
VKDKDRDLIFEAYQLMHEMPVRLGTGADDPDLASKFDKEEIERLMKYKVPDAEMINKIVARVFEFIKDHEGEEYPELIKQFKGDIIDQVRDVSGIGTANGKYVARVISNALLRLDAIEVDGATQRVKVNSVDEKELEDAIEDKVQKVVTLQNNVKYEVGKESNATPDSDVYKAHEVLKRQIGAGFSADGRLIITALMRELSTVEAKALANKLLQTDGIFVPESEEEDEERIIDTGEEEIDNRYAADDYAAKHFGDMGGGSMD